MKLIQRSEDVYFAHEKIIKIDVTDILVLKEKIPHLSSKRARICAHSDSSDSLHEMFIVISNQSYIRPHKHLNKSESFHVVEGVFDVVLFDDQGKILEIIPMGDYKSGKKFFYRLSIPCFHTLVLHSDFIVLHETTNGPFRREETIYASWSPDTTDNPLAAEFMSNLEKKIKKYRMEPQL